MENKETRLKRFLSKVEKTITHNTFLKVMSLLFAFIVWFAVVNYTNPEVRVTVKANVEVRNDEELKRADRIYSLEEKSVSISYKVRTENRNKVKPNDFTAYIDLADYSITGAVPVYVEVSEDVADIVSDVTHDPLIVHVNTEDIIRRRFEVNGVVTGVAADGYVVGDVRHDPEYVYVTGTSTNVSKIAKASFEVSVNGAREDVSGNEKIILSDSDGKRLTIDVKVEPYEYADYTVKIYKTKSLTMKAMAEGLPADGYVVDSIETSPTFISVYGDDEILNSTPYLIIPRYDINIDGITENKTLNLDVTNYLPEGVYLNNGNPELVVLVKIRSVMQLPEQSNPNGPNVTVPAESQPAAEQSTLPVTETIEEQVVETESEAYEEATQEEEADSSEQVYESTEESTESFIEETVESEETAVSEEGSSETEGSADGS